jgi:hypothetical protein
VFVLEIVEDSPITAKLPVMVMFDDKVRLGLNNDPTRV